MKKQFYILLLFSILLYTFAFSQEKEAVKQQAQQELQAAPPDQIRTKIKETGMSEKEATERANALGIDLQQYLNSAGQSQTELDSSTVGKKHKADSLLMNTPEIQKMALSVPGFEGRDIPAELLPFGYNIFQFPTSTFEPVLNLPTASNYLLGPGDEILLTMWGETQLYLPLTINREGNIVIPNVGPVVAQGVTIEALKSRLMQRHDGNLFRIKRRCIKCQYVVRCIDRQIAHHSSFCSGRSNEAGWICYFFHVHFLFGLYVAGGPTMNGSLRSIDVLRNNKIYFTN